MPSSPSLSKAETVTPPAPSETTPTQSTSKPSSQPRKQKQKDKEFLLGNFLRETFFSSNKSASKLKKKAPTSSEPAHHAHALFTHNEEPLRADQSALMPRHAGRKPGSH